MENIVNLLNDHIEFFKKGGIYIKPENRGKFNATKKRTGKTTEELTHSKNPVTRKRAIFAQNAAKWHKKKNGGIIFAQDGSLLNVWQKAYNSKFGKKFRTFLFGTDNELSNEEYIQKHGFSRPLTGFAPLPTVPESGPFEGIEYLTKGHFGTGARYNSGLQQLATERRAAELLKTAKSTPKEMSKWSKFLQKSAQEQDDIVRYWNGERFRSLQELKSYPKEFGKFQRWINNTK